MDGEGEGSRQFNVWRNVARLFARTEFVMMLDVDFAVCTDWRGAIRRSIREADQRLSAGNRLGNDETSPVHIAKLLQNGSAALVVPVFEYASQEDGEDQMTFPQDKEVRIYSF